MESIQSSTTPDPGYQRESNKLTVRHHKREPRINVSTLKRFYLSPIEIQNGQFHTYSFSTPGKIRNQNKEV